MPFRFTTPRERAAILSLRPEVQDTVHLLFHRLNATCSQRDWSVRVAYGFRSPEKQLEVYARGRTMPGPRVTYALPWQSAHCFGLAADIAVIQDKAWARDDHPGWRTLGELAEGLGLAWGGRWRRPVDCAHVEARDWKKLVRDHRLDLELAQRLHRAASVVFSTTASATPYNLKLPLPTGAFDFVILEEAAKGWLPEMAMALTTPLTPKVPAPNV